ncbi:unnamed protein product, partial [Meganyctiphanes norvegica]
GIYRIRIQTHDGVTRRRTFNVTLTGQSDTPGMSCNLVEDFMSLPHILVAADTVLTQVGSTIKIPCEVTGHDIRVTWHFQGTALPAKSNQQVNHNGDLVIRQITAADQGTYSCYASSRIVPQSIDHAHTLVHIRQ